MGEAKRRKRLDPNFGKTNKSLKIGILGQFYDSQLSNPIVNNNKIEITKTYEKFNDLGLFLVTQNKELKFVKLSDLRKTQILCIECVISCPPCCIVQGRFQEVLRKDLSLYLLGQQEIVNPEIYYE